MAPLPPGSFGLPLIGEILEFAPDTEKFAAKRHAIYGPVFKTKLMAQPTVFAKGAEANRFILSNENTYFRSNSLPSMRMLLGDNSLSMQVGDVHARRRRLLAKAFSPRVLGAYTASMEAITDQYLSRWLKLSEFAWYPELRKYTFDVACKFLIGLDNASESQLGNWFEAWGGGLFSLLPKRIPFTSFDRAYRSRLKILDWLDELIAKRKQQADSGEDALGILLEAFDENGRLSDEELKDQILMLLFAGHETLTSALSSFCYLMAQHPKKKEIARANVDQASSNGELALKEMDYLEQAIQESMRMIAPVGGGFRKVLEPCTIDGFHIPKDWLLIYSIARTHEDDTVFAHSQEFEPERFAPSSDNKVGKYDYLPFGGGIRECLGKEFARLEMKLFAAKLLKDFDWQLLPDQDLSMLPVPTPHPKDGLRVQISKR